MELDIAKALLRDLWMNNAFTSNPKPLRPAEFAALERALEALGVEFDINVDTEEITAKRL
jgi:hypothetical protein